MLNSDPYDGGATPLRKAWLELDGHGEVLAEKASPSWSDRECGGHKGTWTCWAAAEGSGSPGTWVHVTLSEISAVYLAIVLSFTAGCRGCGHKESYTFLRLDPTWLQVSLRRRWMGRYNSGRKLGCISFLAGMGLKGGSNLTHWGIYYRSVFKGLLQVEMPLSPVAKVGRCFRHSSSGCKHYGQNGQWTVW